MTNRSKRKFPKELLREEVNEWTELLRSDDSLDHLRMLLRSRGFEAEQILLAHFMEDEIENEYGVFVTPSGKIHKYRRSTSPSSAPNYDFVVEEVEMTDALDRDYPQVQVALEMVNKS